MDGEAKRERLDRLRSELAELRARSGDPRDDAGSGGAPGDLAGRRIAQAVAVDEDRGTASAVEAPEGSAPAPDEARPEAPPEAPDDGWGPTQVSGRPRAVAAGAGAPPRVRGREARAAHREATTTARPPSRFRRRVPRPPRRSPFRPRARRPPKRLAVPTPIPVRRRPTWVAAPRWPTVGLLSGAVIALVMVPAVAQLAYRLWQAMVQTSVLLGAEPTRIDALRAAAGVAGGGLTLAIAITALAIVRGRPAYLSGAVAVVLLFMAFPWIAYRANAGIVAAPLPSLGEAVAPPGWEGTTELRASFALVVVAAVLAVGDLVWRSTQALRTAWLESRTR